MSLKHPKSGSMAAAALLKSREASSDGTIFLSQQKGGRPLAINIGHAASKESPQVPSETVVAIQKELKLSNSGTKKFVTMLNQAKPGQGKLVEENTRAKLSERVHEIMQFFKSTLVAISGKTYKVTHVTDLDAFIDYVLEKRNLHLSDVNPLVNQDWGQGSLKCSLNLIDMTIEITIDERKTRRLGEFKDSGVDRTLVLAKADELEESPSAFRAILDLINPGKIHYTNACDFKAGNMLAGVQSAMSKHCCLYCVALNDRCENGLSELGEMRTIGRVIRQFEKWHADSKGLPKKKDLQDYESCSHEPILNWEKKGELILYHIAPDELHLLLGIVPYLTDRINCKWDIHDWLLDIGLHKNKYHKFEMNGRACQLVVDNIDSLETLAHFNMKFEVQSLLNTLRVFGKVVHSCFGMQLREGWEANIKEFHKSWEQLIQDYAETVFFEDEPKIMYTEKVHILIFHVPEFCRKYGALGPWSTQAGESLHSRLKQHCANYQNAPKNIVEDRDLWAIADWNAKAI